MVELRKARACLPFSAYLITQNSLSENKHARCSTSQDKLYRTLSMNPFTLHALHICKAQWKFLVEKPPHMLLELQSAKSSTLIESNKPCKPT